MTIIQAAARAACATVLALGLTTAAPASAHEISSQPSCLGGRVVIDGADEYEAELVCRGITAAAAVLGRCGYAPPASVAVEFANRLIDVDGFARRGEYITGTRLIRLQTLAAFMTANKASFAGVPVSFAALYASIAAHEMTHAIFGEAASRLDLVPTAHEYSAYAVQVATLPPGVRDALLAKYPEPPAESLFVFSPFLLYADPERFAVAAWRHFTGAGSGCGMLDRIVSEKVHFPPPGD